MQARTVEDAIGLIESFRDAVRDRDNVTWRDSDVDNHGDCSAWPWRRRVADPRHARPQHESWDEQEDWPTMICAARWPIWRPGSTPWRRQRPGRKALPVVISKEHVCGVEPT